MVNPAICRVTAALTLIVASLAAPALAAPQEANADASTGTNLVTTHKLNWRTAEALAAEAVSACEQKGFSVTASVVDPSGHQQAVIKGDSVPLQSLSVSYRKAYTAYAYGLAFHRNSTSELVAAKEAGPEGGAVLATEPEIIFIPGGVTLRAADGSVIGGIGVSGASGGDKDEACAWQAVHRYQSAFH